MIEYEDPKHPRQDNQDNTLGSGGVLNNSPSGGLNASDSDLENAVFNVDFSEPQRIDDACATIQFVRNLGTGRPVISRLSVIGKLDSGESVVRYRLIPEPSGEVLESLRRLLEARGTSLFSTRDILDRLGSISRGAGNYNWRIESISPERRYGDCTQQPRIIAPSFADFVADPEALGRKLLSEKRENGRLYRLETEVNVADKIVTVALGPPNGQRIIDTEIWLPHAPSNAEDAAEIPKRLRAMSTTIHTIFSEDGIGAAREFVNQNAINNRSTSADTRGQMKRNGNEPSRAMLAMNRWVGQCDVSRALSSGAHIRFVITPQVAILSIQGGPSDNAARCSWTFRDEWGLADEASIKRASIRKAFAVLASEGSDDQMLDAIRVLCKWKESYTAKPSSLGAEFNRLQHPKGNGRASVWLTDVVPTTEHEILDVCRGTTLLRVQPRDRARFDNNPGAFHSLRIGIRSDGAVTVHAHNKLGGELKAFLSNASVIRYGGPIQVTRLLAAVFGDQPGRGRIALQQVVRGISLIDPRESWSIISEHCGHPSLPPALDVAAHQAYDLGARLVFDSIDATNRPSIRPRGVWLKSGVIEIVLDKCDGPWQLSIVFEATRVSQIRVLRRSARTVPASAIQGKVVDGYHSDLHVESDIRARLLVRNIIEQFIKSTGDKPFDQTTLRALLQSKAPQRRDT